MTGTIPRSGIRFPAEIQVADGRFQVIGVDLGEHGIKVLSQQAWPVGTIVFLDLKCFWLMGFAKIRKCAPHDHSKCAVDLQFCAPLMHQELGTWEIRRICYDQET